MKRHFTAVLAALLASVTLWGGEDAVIRNGRPTREAFYNINEWRSEQDGLCGTGTGNPLYAGHLYSPGEFEVNLTLRLAKFQEGAPRVLIGDVCCGFDGKGRNLFIETSQTPARLLPGKFNTIVPGKPFQITVRGKNGTLQYILNGQLLTEYPYPADRPLSVGVNPWRDTLSIAAFSVKGTKAGLLSSVLPVPVCRELTDITQSTSMILPECRLPAGKYRGILGAVCGQGIKAEQEMELDEDNMVELPAELLTRVYRELPGDKLVKTAELSLKSGDDFYRCRITLYDPKQKAVPATGTVYSQNGSAGFLVNGKPVGTHSGSLGFWEGRIAGESASRFGGIGIDGSVFLLNAYEFMDSNGQLNRERLQSALNQRMAKITARNPNVYFKIYFHLYMPPAWCKKHPEELIKLDNGTDSLEMAPGKIRQPSYASELWRKQMGTVLRQAIQVFRESPFADRIPYLRLCYANCGEWNHWGYHEHAFVDYSLPMQRAFGKWLKKKYGTEEALRKAWGRDDADFNPDNLVPSRADRLKGGDFLRLGGTETQNSVDYYAFFQEFAAETILYFAKIAKEASGRRLAVGAYYGYYFGHYGSNPYHFQDSGNYGVGKLLHSADIDFIGGPAQYHNRRLQLELNGITGSVNLHGKIWESEGDQRTHLSGEQNKSLGTTDNLSESIAIAKRDFMLNLQRKSSYYFYDFVFDWYRDPEFMTAVGRLREIDSALRSIRRKDHAETAFLFSEETIPYLTSRGSGLLREFVKNQIAELPRLGLPVDYYLMSDLDRIDFSRYKVVLFVNAYYADNEMIRKVQKYAAKKGRTLIFLHAPGVVGDSNRLDPEQSARLTGIRLAVNPDASAAGIRAAWGQMKSAAYRFRTEISDPSAKIIARHEDGTPAGAERQFSDHKSIVICHPLPNAVFLRGLLAREKIRWLASGKSGLDQVNFAGPLISVYSRSGGAKTLWLTEPAEIVADLFTGEILGKNLKTVNFQMPPRPETRILYAGSAAEYEVFRTANGKD